jgi:hypothetical protein
MVQPEEDGLEFHITAEMIGFLLDLGKVEGVLLLRDNHDRKEQQEDQE